MRNSRDIRELLKDLLNLVKPLRLQMFFAIFFGLSGHVFATLIPGLGAYYFGKIYIGDIVNLKKVLIILLALAVLRSITVMLLS